MLVAVEGPSAVGKTTLLLNTTPASRVVGEEWEAFGVPRGAGPARPRAFEAQRFWVDLNARRWRALLDAESDFGTAYADTDPLKLYYNFALAKLGEIPYGVFEEGWRQTQRAVEERRLGFVDRVLFLKAPRVALAERKAADASRTRRNFELHVRLTGAMESYYAALERLRPGSVYWLNAKNQGSAQAEFASLDGEEQRRERYDLALLHGLRRELDRLLRSEP